MEWGIFFFGELVSVKKKTISAKKIGCRARICSRLHFIRYLDQVANDPCLRITNTCGFLLPQRAREQSMETAAIFCASVSSLRRWIEVLFRCVCIRGEHSVQSSRDWTWAEKVVERKIYGRLVPSASTQRGESRRVFDLLSPVGPFLWTKLLSTQHALFLGLVNQA